MFKKTQKHAKTLVAAAGLTAAVASNAMAVAIVDYSTLATAVTAEISPTIVAILPIAGTLLAVGVGWKLVRRFVK